MNGAAVRAYSKSRDGDLKLSANFRVREFACKDGSDTVFISDDLVRVLQQIREHFDRPVTINSAYRTYSHNRACGGAVCSQHLYGTAADIVVQGVAPGKVADYARQIMPKFGGVGRYRTFTHVDVRAVKSDWVG